ncbi:MULTISPECIES: hypothetical protein [Sphingomonas]|jgi:hypothetical protein|uniref:hypothetical protein n=1 Tax=Sphingomonas TaxID=13687 RepID=UPI001AED6283|nr:MULTISPECIES: hypothetical protein [Sphingomonas]
MSWREKWSSGIGEPSVSRAINLAMDETDVRAGCTKHGAAISAIETLQSGGTRVVLMNGAAAETMRMAFGKRVLSGTVQRTPLKTWAR